MGDTVWKYKNSVMFIIAIVCIISAVSSVNAADNVTNSTCLADSAWPGYQNDEGKTGQSNYTGPQVNATKWTYNNITVHGSAAIGKNGNVHVAGDDGVLYTFNSDGKLLWYYVTRSNIYGSPTIGNDGTIYFSNWANATTYAIKSDGTFIWECTTGGYNFGSSPVIGSDGTVYIPSTNSTNGALYAIDTNGKVKWAYNMGIIRATSPVMGSDGTIYMADYDGVVYAINTDGTLKWSHRLKYPLKGVDYYVNIDYNTPILGPDGTIYIATHNGRYIGKDKNEIRSYIGVLYAFTDNGTGYEDKWYYDFGEALYGSPAISSNGTIYIISASGLQILDPDGNRRSYNAGEITETGLTSPAIGKDGTIYFGSGKNFYALTSSGDLKWKHATGNVVGSPAIGSDGTLYIGTLEGAFYAFNDIVADFVVGTVKGTTLTQKFTGSTTGTPKSWKWEFGDGTTSTEQNPIHTYKKAGKFTVTLTVLLQDGTTVTRTKKITITKQDITAPKVTDNLKGGTYNNTQHVKLTATDDSNKAVVYYTMDGSDPRTSSTRRICEGSVAVTDSMTFKYAAVDPSGNWSPVYTKNYKIIDVVYVQKASNYDNKTINKAIQAILDGASPGSNIIFKGSSYENLQLVINKKLNIISNVGTKIITNLSGFSVFLINGTKASGTIISGFNIVTNTNSGILVNNADNVTISDVQISSNRETGIMVNGSSNTTIENSTLKDSLMGVQIYNSSKTLINKNTITGNQLKGVMIDGSTNTTVSNSSITGNGDNSSTETDDGGIYIQNSNQVYIRYNEITNNFMGISTSNVSNLIVNNNTISDNFVDGIYLTGYARNVTIKYNTIQRNANGIGIDYHNNSEKIDIYSNLISNSVNREDKIKIHSDYGWFTSGDGVTFGINYITATGESIKHNVIAFNEYRDVDGHDELNHGDNELPVGPNVYTNDFVSMDTNFCCKINTKPAKIELDQVGNVLTVYFRDGETGEIITDLPPIDVTIIINNRAYQVRTEDGIATLTVPPSDLNGEAVAKFANNMVKKLVLGQKGGEDNYVYINPNRRGFFISIDDEDNNNDEDDNNDNDNGGNDDNNNGNGNDGDDNNNGNGDDGGDNNNGNDGDDNNNGNNNDNGNDDEDNGSGNDGSNNGNDGGPNDGNSDGSTNDPGSESDSGSSSDDESTDSLAVGTAAALSGASSPGSDSSSQSGSSKTVQELILNENSPWGILVIILLIILVAGAYYRNDIMNMIKKSRK